MFAQLQDLQKSPESVRDISVLMDGGAYMSEARSWRDTPPCLVNGRHQQDQVTARGSLHMALAMSTCPGVLATPPLHKVLLTHRTFILTTQQPAMDHSYKKMLAAQNICKIL